MKTIASTVFIALVAAIYLPGMFEAGMLENSTPESGQSKQASLAKSKRKGPKIARAYRDEAGHFSFNAKLNGNHEKVLVDTGASIVAINWTTARRIGIQLSNADFKHKVNTANGQANMASATIDEVRIDGIVARDVRAAVLHDTALNGTLLGMSFLNKLKRFEIENRTLKLTQ